MTKEQLQIEELSQAIDAMNAKKSFHTADADLEQLLHTASFVKEYGCTTEETMLVSQLTEQISREMTIRRRRKRILSAVMGVAAAAVLFAGVSFRMPFDGGQQVGQQIVQSPQVAIVEKSDSAAALPDKQTLKEQPVAAPSSPPAAARSVQPEESPRRTVASLPPAKQERSDTERLPAVAKATKSESAVLMILPDRVADSVMTEAGGTVRHVYGKDTDKEIIITQRLKTAAEKTEADAAAVETMTAEKQVKKAAATLNKAKRKVNGIEIVVEGKQDQAELEKVADALVPVSSPDSKKNADSDKN